MPQGRPIAASAKSISMCGAFWCKMVCPDLMSTAEKTVRQSISLPVRVARRVKSLAKTSSTSANRIIVDLIESGIEAQEQEKARFLELADRLARSSDADEQKRLKEELARMTFGD
jgi:predicted DNA-binding protein